MEEEEKETQNPERSSEESRTKVGFPQAQEKKSGFNFRVFLFLLLALLAIGAGAWYLFGRSNEEIVSDKFSPTPSEEAREETPTPPEESVDRKDIKLQILNGTGIPGVAGKLQTALEKLGYSNFKTGNADNFSYKVTQVSFKSSVPEAIRREIENELDKLYESVEVGTKEPEDFDVSIIVGFTKGYTPTPTSKPKPTGTPTPNVSLTGTPSVTVTVTPTP